jgi:hypothetical protein
MDGAGRFTGEGAVDRVGAGDVAAGPVGGVLTLEVNAGGPARIGSVVRAKVWVGPPNPASMSNR